MTIYLLQNDYSAQSSNVSRRKARGLGFGLGLGLGRFGLLIFKNNI